MRLYLALVLTLLAPQFVTAQTPPPAPMPPAPHIKPEDRIQVSPHVHVIPDNSVQLVTNVGIIVGDRAVLVVDTGMGPPNGAKVFAEAQKLGGSRALYLVTTHVHAEHDLGAQAFPASTTFIRAKEQETDIAEFGLAQAQNFASRSPAHAEMLKGAAYRKADIIFEREYDLDLGGVRVKLYAMGPNHTRGDTAIWVEGDRVLFAGDIAMKAQPAFSSVYSNLRQWILSLARLEALNPALVVPSHGPNGDVGFIKVYRDYLTEVRDRTAAEKRAGRSVEQATETVTAALVARYPDRARLAGAIKAAYVEAP
jgi:glyoxylase-like metal-dependent hydrolase (beta-lactamase superfamily II)